jgi:AraC family transcriptional regulator of adaptative response/methylated-DNA-[protein]-cysteine methyltransferase
MNARQLLKTAGHAPTDAEWSLIAERRRPAVQPWLIVVTSTGIVCSIGCAARLPARENVRVVRDLDEGLAAGARPCLRCHPERHVVSAVGLTGSRGAWDGVSPEMLVQATIDRLTSALESGDEPPTDRQLAAAAQVPERRLRDEFRDQIGVTPRSWFAARRAERLRAHLSNGHDVLGALFDAGYGSSSAAYEAAATELGMAPGRYRTGGAGEQIRWTVAPIPDGVALVAATDRGLCAVRLGTEPAALEADLRNEYPSAAVMRDDSSMGELAALVTDLAAGRPRPEATTLPLDVHATAFRRRVWEALRRIPAGETRSYGQVAASVGAPKAARAVGTACAENPVAIVVPCHRVVGSDGSLHGYAYGLARKKQLLDAERSAPESRAPALASAGRGGRNAG